MPRFLSFRCSVIVLALFAICGGSVPAAAQYFGQNKVHYRSFDFQILKTDHFDIYFYESERPGVDIAARMAERWRVRLERLLKHELRERQPLVLYGSHTDFEQTNIIGGAIGDGFGWVGGRRHTGVDIPADEGTPVGAAGRGVVVFAGWNDGGYGNLVVVKHRLGFESWYAHLSRIAADEGEAVVGGTRIGYVGSTGHTTGPHLHFEVRHFGTPIDPVPRLLGTVALVADTRTGTDGRLTCRPNADAWGTRDSDPFVARFGHCP